MSRPTISVLVAARDAEELLPRALQSVAMQDDPPDEVVVVDDGSSDGTAEVARSFGARTLTTDGVGAGPARNLGAEHATGDLVAFLDADDAWSTDYCRHLRAAATDGVRLVSAHVRDRTTDGVPVRVRLPAPPETRPVDVLLTAPLLTSAVAVDRRLLLEVGGFGDHQHGEDAHLWMRLLHAGARPAPSDGVAAYTVRDPGESKARVEAFARDHRRLIDDAIADGLVEAAALPSLLRAHHRSVGIRFLAGGHRPEARSSFLRALPDRESALGLLASVLPDAGLAGVRALRRAARVRREA